MENTTLKIVYADSHLGVKGDGFEYLFSYQMGGLSSFNKDGIEWMYRPPRPALWRPVTDNDRGNFFHHKSGMWLAADAFIKADSASVCIDGASIPLPLGPYNNSFTGQETAHEAKITFVYKTITSPSTDIDISYTVTSDGRIRVDGLFHGQKGLPELPVFGIRMIMPTVATGFTYEGLSGETYPDRKCGGVHGVYDVEGLPMSAYLVPQECGMHMDTDWVKVKRNTSLSNVTGSNREGTLCILKAEEQFAFTALPYTPMEIESADHMEALPLPRRTVLTVYGAVRGVGGMDSWGADVEEAYHVSAEEDIRVSFIMS